MDKAVCVSIHTVVCLATCPHAQILSQELPRKTLAREHVFKQLNYMQDIQQPIIGLTNFSHPPTHQYS